MHPLHNPIIEIIQHTTTPATSTLLIFLTHKFNHLKKMKLFISSKFHVYKYEREKRAINRKNDSISSVDDNKKSTI